MPREFGNWRKRLLDKSPTWLSEGFAAKLIGLQGLFADAFTTGFFQSIKVPMIASPASPDDALEFAGKARNLERYPGETNPRYRARLLKAWDIWKYGGTFKGIEDQLLELGLGAHVIAVDRLDPNWSRFSVEIYSHPWSIANWGESGAWYPPNTLWGISGAGQYDIDAIRSVIAKWKPATWVAVDIIITIGAPNLWGHPDQTWGEGDDDTWGGGDEDIRISAT